MCSLQDRYCTNSQTRRSWQQIHSDDHPAAGLDEFPVCCCAEKATICFLHDGYPRRKVSDGLLCQCFAIEPCLAWSAPHASAALYTITQCWHARPFWRCPTSRFLKGWKTTKWRFGSTSESHGASQELESALQRFVLISHSRHFWMTQAFCFN